MRQNAGFQKLGRPRWSVYAVVGAAALAVLTLGLIGCGQTAKIVTPSTVNEVRSYFGISGQGNGSELMVNHAANQVTQLFLQQGQGNGLAAPTPVSSGTFAASQTGFLNFTETLAFDAFDNPTNPTTAVALPCPLHGSWGVEIPGDGALANLLFIGPSRTASFCPNPPPLAPPANAGAIIAANSANCPNFTQPVMFIYVVIPPSSASGAFFSPSNVDYGIVGISSQNNAVTFQAQPFLVGQPALPASTVEGGCSISPFGFPLTAYPLNASANSSVSTAENFAISPGGLLVDGGNSAAATQNGALGQNANSAGAVGVAMPASPVDVSAVVGAKYSGFLYAPGDSLSLTNPPANDGDGNPITFDASVLASGYGDNAGNAPACMALQNSIAANLVSAGNGGTIVAPPSMTTALFGGEFKNSDPSGANGMTERCDVAIDLGQQDPQNNGVFPKATIFIGQNYPPATDTSVISNPCITPAGLPCAFANPAVAVVGKVQNQFVIFVKATGVVTLTQDNMEITTVMTQLGIFLFQKTQ